MTAAVKSGSTVVLDFARSSFRTAAEPEPVMPTVDHADIRGLGTTLLGSVQRLPRI
jgi:hypothetical protein